VVRYGTARGTCANGFAPVARQTRQSFYVSRAPWPRFIWSPLPNVMTRPPPLAVSILDFLAHEPVGRSFMRDEGTPFHFPWPRFLTGCDYAARLAGIQTKRPCAGS
jgi:hypothetical protein